MKSKRQKQIEALARLERDEQSMAAEVARRERELGSPIPKARFPFQTNESIRADRQKWLGSGLSRLARIRESISHLRSIVGTVR